MSKKSTRKFTAFNAKTLEDLNRQVGEFARDVYSRLDGFPAFDLVTYTDFINPLVTPFIVKTSIENPTNVIARVRLADSPETVITIGAIVSWVQASGGIKVTRVLNSLSTAKYKIDFLIIGDWP